MRLRFPQKVLNFDTCCTKDTTSIILPQHKESGTRVFWAVDVLKLSISFYILGFVWIKSQRNTWKNYLRDLWKILLSFTKKTDSSFFFNSGPKEYFHNSEYVSELIVPNSIWNLWIWHWCLLKTLTFSVNLPPKNFNWVVKSFRCYTAHSVRRKELIFHHGIKSWKNQEKSILLVLMKKPYFPDMAVFLLANVLLVWQLLIQ